MRNPTLKELNQYREWMLKQTAIEIIEKHLNPDNGSVVRRVKNYEIGGEWNSDDQGGSSFGPRYVTGLLTDGTRFEMGYGYDDNDYLVDDLYNVSSLADDYSDEIYGEVGPPPFNLKVIDNE